MFITIYNNSMCVPISDSIRLDIDPSQWLGEPDCKVGSITSWLSGAIVIVLSDTELTTST